MRRAPLSLPKTSSGVTECDGCASGRRDVRLSDQAAALPTSPTEVTVVPEAENPLLRQQVTILIRKSPSRVRLRNIRSADLCLAVPILPLDSECAHRGQAGNPGDVIGAHFMTCRGQSGWAGCEATARCSKKPLPRPSERA